MANRNQRTPENVPGAYYVDDSCIDCDVCRNVAPRIFARHEVTGYSYVMRQPVTLDEIAEAEKGRDSCPTDTIGNDG